MTNQQQGWGQPDPNEPPQQQYEQQQYGQQQYGQQQYGQAPQQAAPAPYAQYGAPSHHGQPTPYGQPPQQGVAATGQGFIEFTMQGSVMTASMVVPTLTIDGHVINARYGLNTIPVPAGPHHISVVGQWMRAYGQAELDLTVRPGEHVPVYYAAPFHQFTTGNIGHEPQKRKGLGVLLAICISVPLLILVIAILAAGLS